MQGNPSLDDASLLRLPEVLRAFPVSQATWLRGVRSGIYPKPVRLSQRTVAWRGKDIRELVESVAGAKAAA